MKITVLSEVIKTEDRVGLTPSVIKKIVSQGVDVCIQSGCGARAGFADSEYEEAGAKISRTIKDAVSNADIIITVRRPNKDQLEYVQKSTILIGLMDPYGNRDDLQSLAKNGCKIFSMELMPRISRAQSMDVLSSQSNLSGYKAVIDAAATYGRALPMMMTAAGTIPPARAFIMGAGVAGLQAIATARRMGAIVTATDVRPASKEQVESLGAKFVAVEDDEFKAAETSGGYAKEMSDEYKNKQQNLVAEHIAKQDIVITTALIPGRKAPILITKKMIDSMRKGSVIADLAIERGGNVEMSRVGKIEDYNGVSIIGYENFAARLPADSSNLYSQNIYNFLGEIINYTDKRLEIKSDDEIILGILIADESKLVHKMYN